MTKLKHLYSVPYTYNNCLKLVNVKRKLGVIPLSGILNLCTQPVNCNGFSGCIYRLPRISSTDERIYIIFKEYIVIPSLRRN